MTRHLSFFLKVLAVALPVLLQSCNKEGSNDPYDPLKNRDKTVCGTLTFDDGTPAAGVSVSDGYTSVVTDASGQYTFTRNKDAYYVFYSLPGDAQVEIGANGLPVFFRQLSPAITQYDFKLKKQAGETKFRLICLGDIQVDTDQEVRRFSEETCPDVREYVKSKGGDMPTYAIQMGDLVFNKWTFYPSIIPHCTVEKLGVPMFSVIGNHDHEFVTSGNLEAQRKYEAAVAPVNYSFNRGDVHVLVLDDIIHPGKESATYDEGLLDWQYEWVKQDLANVSRDKHLVVAAHAPFGSAFSGSCYPGVNHFYDEILALMSEFKSCNMIGGHSHTSKNSVIGKGISEFVVASVGGGDWLCTVCNDGTPYGYAVLEFDGPKLANHIYKATKYDENMQMRIYVADDFPAITSGGTTYKWNLKSTANRLIVNVWNYEDGWTFDVYENGVKTDNKPTLFKSIDMWVFSYYFNRLAKTNHGNSQNNHMFYYNLKDPSCRDIRIVAHDKFGHSFECNKITTASADDMPNTYRN